jgi:hypothetical protein
MMNAELTHFLGRKPLREKPLAAEWMKNNKVCEVLFNFLGFISLNSL